MRARFTRCSTCSAHIMIEGTSALASRALENERFGISGPSLEAGKCEGARQGRETNFGFAGGPLQAADGALRSC